jgi:RHS repeat-associated protein
MLKTVRSVMFGLLCCVVGVGAFSTTVSQGAFSPAGGESGALTGGTVLTDALVIPGVDTLDEGRQSADRQRASRLDPGAIAGRIASQTAFEGLGAAAAVRLAHGAFPEVIDRPAGGPPRLPAGQRIVRYLNDHAAQVDLGSGKRAVLDSLTPIATRVAGGKHAPIDLRLSDAGSVFLPARSAVGVRIPKSLGSGVELLDSGVSLTPVDRAGSALSGAGVLDHQAVMYANTQTDADTVVKPTSTGFETYMLLRSVNSPQELSFRVGLPQGARLTQAKHGPGAVQVKVAGDTVASVLAPVAHDAAGTPVAVSMGLSGDTLTLKVNHRAGDYRYPIAIDPTVTDTKLHFEWEGGNWSFETDFPSNYKGSESAGTFVDTGTGSIPLESWGLFRYVTQHESRIYGFITETASTRTTGKLNNVLEVFNKSLVSEARAEFTANYAKTKTEVCPAIGCATSGGSNENGALFEQVATTPEGSGFTATMYNASVEIVQEASPTASFNKTSPTLSGGATNVLYANTWLGPNVGAFEVNAKDPGIGISEWTTTDPPGETGWDHTEKPYCEGVQCIENRNVYFTYYQEGGRWNTHNLPDGEDTIEFKAVNAAAGSATATPVKVKVDGTAPHNITLTGLPPNQEIGNGLYHPKATAIDGSGTTPSSGVASLVLKVDGNPVGSPSGSCSPGPCTATGEWTISGTEFGVGQHEVTVTATDAAGNAATEKFTMYVSRPTTPISVGPGTVDPQSGELSLSAADVSLGMLQLNRSYGSMHPTAGAEGPLGPQWSLGLGGGQNLTKLPDGDMLMTDGTGLQAVFASKGGGEFTAPTGDKGLVLSEKTVEGKAQFTLKTGSGTVTTFKLPTGGSGTVWLPISVEEPSSVGSMTTSYQIVGGITEPTQIVEPAPEGVTCTSELVRGCRALGFVYAASTTATGENQSEWGDYSGRLKEVTFTAWDPSGAKMATTAVAQYQYDKVGKLRAEWDPRISPALKTTYGYDAAGHVIAATSPGNQPGLFTYGTIQGDARPGRLLAVTRPSASTALGNGKAPTSTTAPAISGSATIGGTVSASTGSWSNSPLNYAYQWENCNSVGAECTPIIGATSSSYTVLPSSVLHTLVVQVTAENSIGAAVAASAASAYVKAPEWYFMSFGSEGSSNGQFKAPGGVAVDASGNVWVADTGNNRIEKFAQSGAFIAAYGSSGSGNGEFNKPTGLAIDPATGKVYVADSANNRVQVFDSEGKYLAQFGSKGTTGGKFEGPAGITILSATSRIDVVDNGNNRIEEFNLSTNGYAGQFGTSGTGINQYAKPQGIAPETLESFNGVIVADTNNNRVEEIFPAFCPGLCMQFGTSGSGNGQFSSPWGVTRNASTGYAYVVDSGNNRVQRFSTGGTYSAQFGSAGSGYGQFSAPEWIAEETTGTYSGGLYISDSANNRIVLASKVIVPDPPMTPPAPPSVGTSAVTTIEYHVPVSGAGAPYAMGSADVAKWAQTDLPSEATAIFPPDEPMSWPAKDYKRASVYYLDSNGRTVNVATPGGGISTNEFNTTNDIVRTLSSKNRQNALSEGSKSAETSQKLDTQTTYNTGAEAGNELLSTVGPLHTVKLAGGTSVEARRHTQYYYDEGAPAEGGPYHLVTKVTVGAQITGESEKDIHTTVTAYGGQENLGWKLRKPTSITSDPSGLKVTHTTVYDPSTGNIIETKQPGASTSGAQSYFTSEFGSLGSGNGQFNHPTSIATDASGNFWVTDSQNNRVEKFSSNGTFIKAYGALGSGELQFSNPWGIAINKSTGNVYVGDTNNNRVEVLSSSGTYVKSFGTKGSGNGAFLSPTGIVVDSSGNVWVADTENNRVQKFNAEGTYQAQFGAKGSTNGLFIAPHGIDMSGGYLYVVDSGNSRVQKFNTEGTYQAQFGTKGASSGQFNEPLGIATDPSTGNLYVADRENHRVEQFNQAGTFLNEFGTNGTTEGHLSGPDDVAVDSAGAVYVLDEYNDRVEQWTPGRPDNSQTIYYSTAANGLYPACGGHAEWAAMPCRTQPASQPETSGLPNLPVSTITYNRWGEPAVTTETFGATTRTNTNTYDSAGRLQTSATSSTVGTSLPTVTHEYDPESGAPVKQKTTVEGTTKTITSVFNTLGELTSYTDADENTSTYTYDVDGRTEKTNDGKGTQTTTYDTTTGALVKLVDTAAGTFTGTYDVEGNLTTEGYPNGMNVNHTDNATGEETGLEYVKTTHCTSACTWFKDTVTPSITGQWLSQTSTLSNQSYTYDGAGRLTQTQDTPAGLGCTTRIYAYDIETNRTGTTTRSPGVGGVCASEGGTTESHSYDMADRLTDTGVGYDTFGDVTKLSAADAGGTELTSTYYVNGTLAGQTQGGQTLGYYLDPEGRTRETISTGTVNSTVTSHYSNEGDSPAWTVNTAGVWDRDIGGIGGFAATQHNGETPVLQVENLHGDIVATVSLSETATGLASTYDTTEYGVPRTGSPPKFSWLGGSQRSTELPSGVIAMGARSYIPQLGRFLQTDPIIGGSANAYAYTFGDPVNSSDPSGEYTPGWARGIGSVVAHEVIEAEAIREAAARAEAQAKAEAAEREAKGEEEDEEPDSGPGFPDWGDSGRGPGSPIAVAAKGGPGLPGYCHKHKKSSKCHLSSGLHWFKGFVKSINLWVWTKLNPFNPSSTVSVFVGNHTETLGTLFGCLMTIKFMGRDLGPDVCDWGYKMSSGGGDSQGD